MFFLPVTSNYYLPTKNHDNHITLFVESFAFSTKSKQNAYKTEPRGFFLHNEKTTNVRKRRAADRPNYIVAVLCFFFVHYCPSCCTAVYFRIFSHLNKETNIVQSAV